MYLRKRLEKIVSNINRLKESEVNAVTKKYVDSLVSGTLLPDSKSNVNLGSSSRAWSEVWAKALK